MYVFDANVLQPMWERDRDLLLFENLLQPVSLFLSPIEIAGVSTCLKHIISNELKIYKK